MTPLFRFSGTQSCPVWSSEHSCEGGTPRQRLTAVLSRSRFLDMQALVRSDFTLHHLPHFLCLYPLALHPRYHPQGYWTCLLDPHRCSHYGSDSKNASPKEVSHPYPMSPQVLKDPWFSLSPVRSPLPQVILQVLGTVPMGLQSSAQL